MRIFLFLITVFSFGLIAEEKSCAVSPAEGMKRLLEGNQRYVEGKMRHPDQSKERRIKTEAIQKPFAAILGCSDSRVPPEILFDQGIGDLFTVRVAGNVLGPVELDSIEYTAFYLGSCFILVLGHENCGAIKAVMAGQTKEIEAVASLITPALAQHPGATTEEAVKDNVLHVIQQLKKSPVLSKLMQKGSLDIRGGYYDFVSGKVELLPVVEEKR